MQCKLLFHKLVLLYCFLFLYPTTTLSIQLVDVTCKCCELGLSRSALVLVHRAVGVHPRLCIVLRHLVQIGDRTLAHEELVWG